MKHLVDRVTRFNPRVGAKALTLVSLLLLPGALVAQSAGSGADPEAGRPIGFSLETASPNPFAEETRIRFQLDAVVFGRNEFVLVSMRVYNILHQLVAVPLLLDVRGDPGAALDELRFDSEGSYRAFWDGRDVGGRRVTPGPYFVELSVGAQSQVRKILLIR